MQPIIVIGFHTLRPAIYMQHKESDYLAKPVIHILQIKQKKMLKEL